MKKVKCLLGFHKMTSARKKFDVWKPQSEDLSTITNFIFLNLIIEKDSYSFDLEFCEHCPKTKLSRIL